MCAQHRMKTPRNLRHSIIYHRRVISKEGSLTRTDLPEWPKRDLLIIQLHVGVYFWIINQSTCIVSGRCICCPYYCLHIKLHSGSSGSEEEAWLELILSNYGNLKKNSFFKPIVNFYINVVTLSTFWLHIRTCQTQVRVNDPSMLHFLWMKPSIGKPVSWIGSGSFVDTNIFVKTFHFILFLHVPLLSDFLN